MDTANFISALSVALAVPAAAVAVFEILKRRRTEKELTGGRAIGLTVESDESRRALYKTVIESVDAAKVEIFKVGRGVSRFADPQDQTIVSYAQAEERALRRGVQIRRIQTAPHVSGEWPQLVASLAERYPTQLRVSADLDDRSLFSGAVVDPHGENPIVELLFDTPRPHLDGDRFLASNVVVIRGNKPLARAIHDTFVRWFNQLSPMSSDDIRRLGFDQIYFAYGANLDDVTMRDRAPSAEALGVGFLDEWALTFGTQGPHLEGGGAAIVPQAGARVWGVIYAISDDDKRRLDATEQAAYDPQHLVVTAREGGGTYEAYVYVPREEMPHALEQSRPDRNYLDRMIRSAERWEIAELVDMLRVLQR